MSTTVEYNIPCTECQGGQMHRRFLTYFTWIGDELITVPDFPSWICDVCGRREYDSQALNQLNLLLNPTAGKPSTRTRSVKRTQDGKSSRPTHLE